MELPSAVGISQQVWVLKGRLDLTVGEVAHRPAAGNGGLGHRGSVP